MMYDIKLIRVFLSWYKRILLSHQIIVSSHRSSFLPYQHLFSTEKKKTRKKRAHMAWRIRRIKVVCKKTQGMRRNSAHLYGVLNTPSSSCQLNYSTRFGCFFYAIMGENWEVGDIYSLCFIASTLVENLPTFQSRPSVLLCVAKILL